MTFTFPNYILAIPVGVGVAALGGLVYGLKQKNPAIAVSGGSFAFLALFIFAPAMMMDRVVLDEGKLEQTTGFWFAPTVKGFTYADVDSVTITTETTDKGLENEVWHVHYKDGPTERIDPGDLWAMHTEEILPRLRENGIRVVRR